MTIAIEDDNSKNHVLLVEWSLYNHTVEDNNFERYDMSFDL